MGMSLSGARPMVTGRVPSGTSFKVARSYFRTSLDILVLSSGQSRTNLSGIPLPDFQSVKNAFRFRQDAQDDHADIVHAAIFVGQIDKAVRSVLRRYAGQQDARDFRIGDHARQS